MNSILAVCLILMILLGACATVPSYDCHKVASYGILAANSWAEARDCR